MNNLMNAFYANEPHKNAPDYVKAKLKIKIDEFIDFLEEHRAEHNGTDLCFIEVCQGKDKEDGSKGSWYPKIDTYQQEKNGQG